MGEKKTKKMGEMKVMGRKWVKLGVKEGRIFLMGKERGCLVVESRDANISRRKQAISRGTEQKFHGIDTDILFMRYKGVAILRRSKLTMLKDIKL